MEAVIYARYSSHNQREESIEGQIRECMDFAKKNGLVVIDEYIDKAISGKTDKRPSFQRLIRDSEKHKFKAVIMYTLDRFARNRYDSAIYKNKLKKNGVRIFYAKQPMPDSPEGIILESVLEGYAEYYSENLKRGVKRGMKENALKAKVNGKTPLGYINQNGKYSIDSINAVAIKEIFERYAEGQSSKEIIKFLNEKGYKTGYNKPFSRGSLYNILKNERYTGVYIFDDVKIENAFSAIISKEIFKKVRNRMEHNKRTSAKFKAEEGYLLTGKLFCGKCGSTMVGESGTSKNGNIYRYYKCSCRKNKKSCTKKPEQKEKLENFIIDYTLNEFLNDAMINAIAEEALKEYQKEINDTSLLDSFKAELKDTESKLQNIMTALEEGFFTPTTKNRLLELEELRGDLERKIAREKIKKPDLTKEAIIYYLESFKNKKISDNDRKRTIIDTLINSIFVYDDERKVIIIFNTSANNRAVIKCSELNELVLHCKHYPNKVFIYKRYVGVVLSRFIY